MDIVTGLSAGLSAIKTALDLLKRGKVDSKELLELQALMLQAQSALGDAQEENRKLKEQVAANDRIKEIEADREWQEDGRFFVRKSEKANVPNFPSYCSVCWGERSKLISLNKTPDGAFHCGSCKERFYTKEYQELSAKRTEEINNSLLRGSSKTTGAGSWMGY